MIGATEFRCTRYKADYRCQVLRPRERHVEVRDCRFFTVPHVSAWQAFGGERRQVKHYDSIGFQAPEPADAGNQYLLPGSPPLEVATGFLRLLAQPHLECSDEALLAETHPVTKA